MKYQPSLLIGLFFTCLLFSQMSLINGTQFKYIPHIDGNDYILTQTNLKAQKMKVTKFTSYLKEYNKIQISPDTLNTIKNKSKLDGERTKIEADQLYAYYNEDSFQIQFTTEKIQNLKSDTILVAEAKYDRTRYQTGWDKLYLRTFAPANPLIQCYVSGYLEGLLTAQEIFYYFSNIHVFFHGEEEYIQDIKNFYGKIDQNLRQKINNPEFFQNLRKSKLDDTSDSLKSEFTQWSYLTCLHAQINGLHQGYNQITSNKQLDLLDFYFINSEGNYGDLKTFMQINKMDIPDQSKFYTQENLQKVYNSQNIEKIWKDLLRKGHCSAIIKLTQKNGKFDIIAGHNTWSEYCEMMRSLKYIEYEFEGNNQEIGMVPRKITYSSYPGVLFSGDDFYELSSGVAILQTTLNVLNKFLYKDMLKVEDYIPEFMRLMIVNLISNSGKEWVDNYKSYQNHMYITQWIVIDYKVLDKVQPLLSQFGNKRYNNNLRATSGNVENMVFLVEEVPGSIMSSDISTEFINETYFGSFNLAYFPKHMQILGLKDFIGIDFTDVTYNPRFYILKHLQGGIKNTEDFAQVLQYNGYRDNDMHRLFTDDPSYKDPGNGISSRDDLVPDGGDFHGGIDFKIVNSDLMKSMNIYAYGGPSKSNPNTPPFDFKVITDFHKDYHIGIPKVWNFSPFYFGSKDLFDINKDDNDDTDEDSDE
jgi:hypothetical protein